MDVPVQKTELNDLFMNQINPVLQINSQLDDLIRADIQNIMTE